MFKPVLKTFAALLALTFAVAATAAYPDKPVRIVVSTTPGSSPDTIARLVAQGLSERVGQAVVVENRGGANGMIGVDAVSRSAPDGYTLLLTVGATLSTNPYLYPTTGGKNVLNLVPITQVASSDFVLAANKAANVNSFAEFVRKAHAEPGKYNVATTAQGSFAYLISESLKQAAKLDYLTVAYNGGGPTMTAFLGGQTEYIIDVATLIAPLIESGKAVALATTGGARMPSMPGVPTMSESGVAGMNVTGWFGLMAPPGTPQAIVDYLYSNTAAVVNKEEFKARLTGLRSVPVASTPADFTKTLAEERRKWADVISASKIKVE